ncbi:MAG: hypothetical protein HZB10_03065 [Candidatus Yonathbacteria bacterium]|nr:hypothetical protein [Candidatus Yonathbacteria bacterium]
MKKPITKTTVRSAKKSAKTEKIRKEFFAFVDVAEHTTPFEARLSDFLARKCRASGVTLADMKDIIWNEQDSNLVSRVTFKIAEQNPKTKIEDIMQVVNEAWNNFPHKKLNGLAPRDMRGRIGEDPDFTFDDRPDFYTIFEDDFPEEPCVVRQGENEWSWEYPAGIHSRRADLVEMRERTRELDDDECAEDLGVEREVMHKMDTVAAKMMLDDQPFMFDASMMLARDMFQEGDERGASKVLLLAIIEGRKIFPAEFILGKDHLPWGFVDNRPFLLLLGEYATLVDAVDGPKKAIPLYEELIALNPNDNQGIRSFLATAYLKVSHLEELVKLGEKYPEDMVSEVAVGALLALYKLDRLDEARKRIKTLRKYFAHTFREILKTEHPQPKLTPGRVLVGGDDEAWLYWQDQGTFWMSTKGAREFLKEELGK